MFAVELSGGRRAQVVVGCVREDSAGAYGGCDLVEVIFRADASSVGGVKRPERTESAVNSLRCKV